MIFVSVDSHRRFLVEFPTPKHTQDHAQVVKTHTSTNKQHSHRTSVTWKGPMAVLSPWAKGLRAARPKPPTTFGGGSGGTTSESSGDELGGRQRFGLPG